VFSNTTCFSIRLGQENKFYIEKEAELYKQHCLVSRNPECIVQKTISSTYLLKIKQQETSDLRSAHAAILALCENLDFNRTCAANASPNTGVPYSNPMVHVSPGVAKWRPV
jgi:hypothetical protein